MMPSTFGREPVHPIHLTRYDAEDQSAPDVPTAADQLASVLERLVGANLSASAMRVGLDTLARLLRQRRTNEAVPAQWMADRLGLHRNAVGLAYGSLVDAGVFRRIPVAERGAPTRTAAAGPALMLLAAVRAASISRADPAGQTMASSCGEPTESHHRWRGVRPAAKKLKQPPPTTPAANDAPRTESETLTTRSGKEAHGIDKTAGQGSTDAEPTATVIETAQAAPREDRHLDPPFRFDPSVNASMTAKIGKDALYLVMRHTPGMPFQVDPAWRLTESETEHLLAMLPKRENRPQRAATPPQTRVAPPAIAKAAMAAIPRLAAALGAERAGQLVDEIAYQVVEKGLGKGDLAGGVRAGVAIALAKRWTTPRGFSDDWKGAVVRGAQQEEGDARQTVH
ncbi:MAG: hypothetical protein EPN31_16275 [Castellaniella sp.]|uniref:hypothetical protein n=1 Tax=Castellaniella sp. TaxID=1955812 RepID=UPI00122A4EB4|nr:hypothetical protein [Castellaniella sp.]TAN24994.1 MAG: hypothetical protein EPN31_16275 [Castellaniella sp.]